MLRESRPSKSTNSASANPASASSKATTADCNLSHSASVRLTDDFGFRPMSSRRRMGEPESEYPARPVCVCSGSDTPSREVSNVSRPSASDDAPVTVNARSGSERLVPTKSGVSGQGKSESSSDSQSRTEVLERLRDAAEMAKRNNRSVWDFAIEISELVPSGTHILRELVCQGLVEHRRETAAEHGHRARQFAPEPELVLSDRSCFVITESGLKYLRRESPNAGNGQAAGTELPTADTGPAGMTIDTAPRWDEEKRELWVGPYLIKRFRWPARNQLAIVREFHRLNWPPRIADPLSQSDKVDPKQRLHDTIKCLNRRRVNKLLKFGGDGTGTGVVFHITPEEK